MDGMDGMDNDDDDDTGKWEDPEDEYRLDRRPADQKKKALGYGGPSRRIKNSSILFDGIIKLMKLQITEFRRDVRRRIWRKVFWYTWRNSFCGRRLDLKTREQQENEPITQRKRPWSAKAGWREKEAKDWRRLWQNETIEGWIIKL